MGASRRIIPALGNAASRTLGMRMSDEFTISQTCRFLKRENCTGLWHQCRTFSCTSNDQDHDGPRHQSTTCTTLSNPRRVSSYANLSIRSYTNTHSFASERRLPCAKLQGVSSAHTATTSGHRIMSIRSWLWQRQYSSESNNTTKKKGLLESQIGQELMTEVAEQNSTPGSFEALGGKLSPDEEAALKEAEAEFEKAQQGKEAPVTSENLQEMLQELQALGDPKDVRIAIISLRLAQEYDARGENPSTTLKLGEQALEIFEASGSYVTEVGMCYHLIASSCHKLGQHDRSLENLNKALKLLENKEAKDSAPVKFAVQFLLGDTLAALGKHEDALQHYVTGLAVQETILDDSHPQLAANYRQVGEAFTQVMLFDEAKALVSRALEMHVKLHGQGSIDEAIDRRLLAVIYSGLEEHEKALEEQKSVRTILLERKFISEVVFVEIAMADTQITLGRFDDAISSLQGALSHLEEGSPMQALATANLAKAYAQQGNHEEAKAHSRKSIEILDSKMEGSSGGGNELLATAECFTELAAIHERMNQPEEAISLLKKALPLFQQMPTQLNAAAGCQAQIGMLLFFTGKVTEAVPYMEEAAKNLRESFGDGHFSLALVLNHLAVAQVELENLSKAVELFEEAKGILTKTHGPGQQDTLAVYHNLMKVYSNLGRKEEAIANARHIVTELEKQGEPAKSALSEAQKDLAELEGSEGSANGGAVGQLSESMKLQGGD